MSWRKVFREMAFFIILGAFLAGCAGRMRMTEPLAGEVKSQALARFHDFMGRTCSPSVDADVTLSWKVLGRNQAVPGMLQAQEPAFLRYTVVDPLGRPLFIFNSDGVTFTLTDNQKGLAYTGPAISSYWHTYIPEGIKPDDFIYWLAGRLRPGYFQVVDARKGIGDNGRTAWVILKSSQGLRHHILFDVDAGRVLRHVLEDREGAIMLDVTYIGMARGGDGCGWPDELNMEGAVSKGRLKVRFDRILSQSVIPPATFDLVLPDYYLIHEVK